MPDAVLLFFNSLYRLGDVSEELHHREKTLIERGRNQLKLLSGFGISGTEEFSLNSGSESFDGIFQSISRPLAIIIDGMQNAVEDRTAWRSTFLQRLYEGTSGALIIPVFAELGNGGFWRSEYQDCQQDSVINLDGPSEDESYESVDKQSGKFRVMLSEDAHEFWQWNIWKWSRGWPEHLHNTLRALARVPVRRLRRRTAAGGCA